MTQPNKAEGKEELSPVRRDLGRKEGREQTHKWIESKTATQREMTSSILLDKGNAASLVGMNSGSKKDHAFK